MAAERSCLKAKRNCFQTSKLPKNHVIGDPKEWDLSFFFLFFFFLFCLVVFECNVFWFVCACLSHPCLTSLFQGWKGWTDAEMRRFIKSWKKFAFDPMNRLEPISLDAELTDKGVSNKKK